jgi:hypothetical protein
MEPCGPRLRLARSSPTPARLRNGTVESPEPSGQGSHPVSNACGTTSRYSTRTPVCESVGKVHAVARDPPPAQRDGWRSPAPGWYETREQRRRCQGSAIGRVRDSPSIRSAPPLPPSAGCRDAGRLSGVSAPGDLTYLLQEGVAVEVRRLLEDLSVYHVVDDDALLSDGLPGRRDVLAGRQR